MMHITKSSEGNCVEARWCFNPSSKKDVKEQWIADNDLFKDDKGRIFTLVTTTYHVYFMDAITGYLYAFGECQSSSELKIKGIKRTRRAGDELMMLKVDFVAV
jgi:hypothetical protein